MQGDEEVVNVLVFLTMLVHLCVFCNAFITMKLQVLNEILNEIGVQLSLQLCFWWLSMDTFCDLRCE